MLLAAEVSVRVRFSVRVSERVGFRSAGMLLAAIYAFSWRESMAFKLPTTNALALACQWQMVFTFFMAYVLTSETFNGAPIVGGGFAVPKGPDAVDAAGRPEAHMRPGHPERKYTDPN